MTKTLKIFSLRCAITVLLMLTVLPAFAAESTQEAPHETPHEASQVYLPTNPPHNLPSLLFKDNKGIERDLNDFRGRYVLLNIWATWCGPCAKEMPSLDALQTKLDAKQVAIIALSEDHDALVTATAFYQRHGLQNLNVYADTDGRAPSVLQLRGLPTTIVIDPTGREIGRIEGDIDWHAQSTLDFLEKILKR